MDLCGLLEFNRTSLSLVFMQIQVIKPYNSDTKFDI